MKVLVTSLFIFLLFFNNSSFAQDRSIIENNLITNLSTLRSKVLTQETKSMVRMEKVLARMDSMETNYQRLYYSKRYLLSFIRYNRSYSDFKDAFAYRNYERKYPVLRDLSKEDYHAILKNRDLFWMLELNMFERSYPYKIAFDPMFFEVLEFYDFSNYEIVANIHSGDGYYSRLLVLLGLDLHVYQSCVSNSWKDYNELALEYLKRFFYICNLEIVEGTSKKIKLPEKIDKIIIRPSCDGSVIKEKKVKSAHKALKKDGLLIICDYISDEDIFSNAILDAVDRSKFELIETKEIEFWNFYKFRKID